MSISKEVPWPKIITTSGEIPMKRRYAFRDMSYLDTLEARPIFETQADIVIKNNFKGIVDIGCRHGPINDFLHEKNYNDIFDNLNNLELQCNKYNIDKISVSIYHLNYKLNFKYLHTLLHSIKI